MILAVGECGYAFESGIAPSYFDIDIYEGMTLRERAGHFVEEGLFGDITEQLQCYIDFASIARDLACDYIETDIAGRPLVYCCG